METSGRLGAHLSQLRAGRNISLGEVARRADISKSAISKWESGCHMPRPEILRLVLDAIGATTAERVDCAEMYDRRDAWCALGLPADRGMDQGCLADALSGLRIQAGFSQREVAFALKVQQSTISRWELGDFEPSENDRHAIARLYGLTAEEAGLLDSISNRDEPLLVRLLRSPEPLEFEALFGTEPVWNYRTDIVRLRAAVHQIKRKRLADPRWDKLFVVAGEQLSSLYMDMNRLDAWLPFSQGLRASLSSASLRTRAGQRIIVENVLANLRVRPLPLGVAHSLAAKAVRFLPGERAWALATAMGIGADHLDQDLVLSLSKAAEEALRECEEPSYVSCVIARYLRWAGMSAKALEVLDRWSDIVEDASSTDMHRAGYFFESADAYAALGCRQAADDAESIAEDFISKWTNANTSETVAIYRATRTLPEPRSARRRQGKQVSR